MSVEIKEYKGGPVCCKWCGDARSKKVVATGSDGKSVVVCRRHFERIDKGLANSITIEAIFRLRESLT